MQWVQTLFLLCEVAYMCQLADIDPVAVAEMTLRLATVLEGSTDSPSLIIPTKCIQLHTVLLTSLTHSSISIS